VVLILFTDHVDKVIYMFVAGSTEARGTKLLNEKLRNWPKLIEDGMDGIFFPVFFLKNLAYIVNTAYITINHIQVENKIW